VARKSVRQQAGELIPFGPQLELQRHRKSRPTQAVKASRQLEQKALRGKIDAVDNLEAIRILISRLEISGTWQYVTDTQTGIKELQRMRDEDVPALKAALDARFKLLDKVLPSLQSVEHTGEVQTGLQDLLALAAERRGNGVASPPGQSVADEAEIQSGTVIEGEKEVTFL
jgi:hypothetical protein